MVSNLNISIDLTGEYNGYLLDTVDLSKLKKHPIRIFIPALMTDIDTYDGVSKVYYLNPSTYIKNDVATPTSTGNGVTEINYFKSNMCGNISIRNMNALINVVHGSIGTWASQSIDWPHTIGSSGRLYNNRDTIRYWVKKGCSVRCKFLNGKITKLSFNPTENDISTVDPKCELEDRYYELYDKSGNLYKLSSDGSHYVKYDRNDNTVNNFVSLDEVDNMVSSNQLQEEAPAFELVLFDSNGNTYKLSEDGSYYGEYDSSGNLKRNNVPLGEITTLKESNNLTENEPIQYSDKLCDAYNNKYRAVINGYYYDEYNKDGINIRNNINTNEIKLLYKSGTIFSTNPNDKLNEFDNNPPEYLYDNSGNYYKLSLGGNYYDYYNIELDTLVRGFIPASEIKEYYGKGELSINGPAPIYYNIHKYSYKKSNNGKYYTYYDRNENILQDKISIKNVMELYNNNTIVEYYPEYPSQLYDINNNNYYILNDNNTYDYFDNNGNVISTNNNIDSILSLFESGMLVKNKNNISDHNIFDNVYYPDNDEDLPDILYDVDQNYYKKYTMETYDMYNSNWIKVRTLISLDEIHKYCDEGLLVYDDQDSEKPDDPDNPNDNKSEDSNIDNPDIPEN